MIYEDVREVHEDVERLEAAVAERLLEEPKHIRSRLIRDHEIANFLERIQYQSERGLDSYHRTDARVQEVQQIGTGDSYASFNAEAQGIKAFHKRNPNQPVENTERKYKKQDREGNSTTFAGDIDALFTGEEAFQYFDLTMLFEQYINLPGVSGARKTPYLQYLTSFDHFTPPECQVKRKDKMSDQYFSYVGSLAQYLESFMMRIKPLENVPKLLKQFDDDFEKDWEANKVPGWEDGPTYTNGTPMTEGTGEGIWCKDCHKEFGNENVYKGHLNGKKHIKNAQARQNQNNADVEMMNNGQTNEGSEQKKIKRAKERAIAEREYRIRRLAQAMQTQREDTRVNVERKRGMTDKERQQEIDALYNEEQAEDIGEEKKEDEDEDDKVYNPLKLPLAWDGKPIPFWLYKLHGLGVEYPCEICGNFVYMGRRAFDKHFSEPKHLHGLQSLGINKHTGLFREITEIEEAESLWKKLQKDKKVDNEDTVQMEDQEGNVLAEKDYHNLKLLGMI